MTEARLQINLAMPQWEVIVDLLLQAPYAKVARIVESIQTQTRETHERNRVETQEAAALRAKNAHLTDRVKDLAEAKSAADQALAEERRAHRATRANGAEAPRKRGRPRRTPQVQPETPEAAAAEQ